MLHQLVDYAAEQGIAGEAGFTPKIARWLITFNPEGEFLGVMDLAAGEKKSKGREFPKAPHLKFCGDTPMRQFLVDTARFAVLLGEDPPTEDASDTERKAWDKLQTKREYFLNLLRAGATADPFLGVVADRLADPATRDRIRSALEGQSPKAKPIDNVTFAEVTSDGDRIIVTEDHWHDWWRGYFPTLFAKKKKKAGKKKAPADQPMRCLLSGRLSEPSLTHPKIKGLADVGGNAESTLVGFNADAFCSYGLKQSANSAISDEMAQQYAAGLNELIARRGHRLAGAKVVYWYTGDVKENAGEDVVGGLFNPAGVIDLPDEDDEEDAAEAESAASDSRREYAAVKRARELLDAIRSGKRPELRNARYCALTLSGNKARVVVRDWMEGSFESLLTNIESWFDDLAINLIDSPRLASPPKFERVLTACLKEKPPDQTYDNWVKPVTAHRQPLWRAALGGSASPIPRRLVEEAVNIHMATLLGRRFILHKSENAADTGTDSRYPFSRLMARMALFRAHCVRFARINQKGDYHVDSALNVNHPRAAYHIGRLMAVLEMIQREAQGDIGATIAQTHYASAATRPIAALPRIETLVQHHLPKLSDRQLARQYQNLLVEIKLNIRDTIPRTFDLEDQCLFHLGYYHQRAFQPRSDPPHKHVTVNGEVVRSKSEVIVANMLHLLGFSYEYESRLCYRGAEIVDASLFGQSGVESLLPDFTIRDTTDGLPIIIEHLGMLDDFAYRSGWERKAEVYRSLGILQDGEGTPTAGHLIVTEEERGKIDCKQLMAALEQIKAAH